MKNLLMFVIAAGVALLTAGLTIALFSSATVAFRMVSLASAALGAILAMAGVYVSRRQS